MNGYTKIHSNINVSSRSMSISMDLSDLIISSPQTQKPNGETNMGIAMNRELLKEKSPNPELEAHIDEEDIDGVNGHVKLSRNCSVSSSSSTSISHSFGRTLKNSTTSSTIQSAVKRAFSIRRSSSVNSERYCRIHDDQFAAPEVEEPPNHPIHDHDDDFDFDFDFDASNTATSHAKEKKKSGTRIFKACRRFLGF